MVRVSEDIESWCIKCKMMLNHVIMSMKGDKPHRVKCKTCKNVHAFRTAEPGTKTKKKTRKTKAKTKSKGNEYEKLMVDRDTSEATKYTIKGKYEVDQLLNHKTFGFGIVLRQLDPTKIEVAFSDGNKILVCGR